MIRYIERLEEGEGIVAGLIRPDTFQSVAVLLANDESKTVRASTLRQLNSHYRHFFFDDESSSSNASSDSCDYVQLSDDVDLSIHVHDAINGKDASKVFFECRDKSTFAKVLERLGFTRRDLIEQAEMQPSPEKILKASQVFGHAHQLMDQMYRGRIVITADYLHGMGHVLNSEHFMFDAECRGIKDEAIYRLRKAVKYQFDFTHALGKQVEYDFNRVYPPHENVLIEAKLGAQYYLFLVRKKADKDLEFDCMTFMRSKDGWGVLPTMTDCVWNNDGTVTIVPKARVPVLPAPHLINADNINVGQSVDSLLMSALTIINAPTTRLNLVQQNISRNVNKTNSKQKQKSPYYDYYVGEISEVQEDNFVIVHERPGGFLDRDSPKVHLRKAHMRRKPNTPIFALKDVFVSEATVGDSKMGVMGKAYIQPTSDQAFLLE